MHRWWPGNRHGHGGYLNVADIERVAVIGAGVMGAGIAAQVANAGVPVSLLDVVPEGATVRNVIAETAIKKMLKTSPAPLMHSRNAKRIIPGNIEDDLSVTADCDLIIEAVVENLEIKKDLYQRLERTRKKNSIVTSNTSTIPLSQLIAELPTPFVRDFAITHFFNPPRYMRLLELVAGPDTRVEVVETLQSFGDQLLGKTVVDCKDTPGFIANRIGILWMESAVRFAIEEGLTVEEADAIVGRPMGIPKTGIFGLMDLVGIDLQPHVQRSMLALLPDKDLYRNLYQPSELVDQMIAEGLTGRKGKGGFYRLNQKDGTRVKEALDLETMTYRPTTKPNFESIAAAKKGLRALVEHSDRGGLYAWRVLSHTLSYAAALVPEIANSAQAVDDAMRNGYAWKWGPFEMIDQLGPAWFADRLRKSHLEIPTLLSQIGNQSFYRTDHRSQLQFFGTDSAYHNIERPSGVLLLSDIKRNTERVDGNRSASLWDIGDGVMCLECHTKMNSLDAGVFEIIDKAIQQIPFKGFHALVIYNEGENFSVGVNLGLALFAANIAAWSEITKTVQQGQRIYKALKYAPFPVVAAPSGMALGGGCELLLHCDGIQAHAETYAGLVEVGVGLVPAWGGCKELLHRWIQCSEQPKGPMPAVTKVFETIGTAVVARSAQEAKAHLFMRSDDGITMNRDRLLADAKKRALTLAENYSAPEKPEFHLPGKTGEVALNMAVNDLHRTGRATAHDVVVGKTLARVLSGGDTDMTETLSEDQVLGLERKAIVDLMKTTATLARMEHMLETGKPLRN
jgi:3-hydroxyacyl-CoA dehydrogenase